MDEDRVRVHNEMLERSPHPTTHPNLVRYEQGSCKYCHAELSATDDGICPVCVIAIDAGLLIPDDPRQMMLRKMLLEHRWEGQGGYVGYGGDGNWDFISSSLSVTPEMMNELFALSGIKPQRIISAGSCKDCKWSDSEGNERGYTPPCLDCQRPLMSNFEPK